MSETDVLLMSLVIFMPTLFAIGLLFFRPGQVSAMRWFSLSGTALTLGLSLCAFVLYQAEVLEEKGVTRSPPTTFANEEDRDKYIEQVKKGRKDATLYSRAHKDNQSETGPRLEGDWQGRRSWIKEFGIEYFIGLDGISLALVVMTTIISFLAMIASWTITKHVKGYLMLFLFLETGMIGCFLALDFFLFFIFWEVMLLPMYFLIGVWGGPRREYAAIKFFLYTFFGSAFILIAMFGFYFTNVQDFVGEKDKDTGLYNYTAAKGDVEPGKRNTFDLILLTRVGNEAAKIIRKDKGNQLELTQAELKKAREAVGKAANDEEKESRNDRVKTLEAREGRLTNQWFFKDSFQYTMFLLLFVGFAIKLPMFPFHTWLPDAHVEAPTPISMILAGVLLKLGGYGIIRIAYPICPFAAKELAMVVATFGMINLVYGAFAAMAQIDFKKLVAYSSISHMGYVLLGIAVWPDSHNRFWEWGMNGAMFQMLAHGISSAGMFFLVGVIYDRAHHRNLNNFRGLYEPMPLYGGMSAIIFFAAMGLPGLCGFIGEFMVVLATWNFSKPMAVVAALTVVITAAYILWTMQRVYMGTNDTYKNYKDMDAREIACGLPLVVLCVLMGVMPFLIFTWMEPSVTELVDGLSSFSL